MRNELINLLPPERMGALGRDYAFRVVVVVAVLATALTLATAALLLPTYVFLEKSAGAKKIRLTSIESALSSVDESALLTRLTALSNNAAILSSLSDAHSVSAIIRQVLVVPRLGVTLSGFSYTPSVGKVAETISISGSSNTRDALRDYQLALQAAPFARSASLPVSAYAKDTDISFSIIITLAP